MYENLTTLEECAAAKVELRKRLEAATAAEELDKLQNEAEELEKRESALKAAAATAEKRSRLMQKLGSGAAAGNTIVNPVQGSQEARSLEDVLGSKEYRSAFAKCMMGRKLNENEQRAVDTVITTTATTAVDATASVDGVNNGGLLIPSELNLSLLKAFSEISPIFRDITKTSIPGVVKFPYKKTNAKAERKGSSKETEDNKNGTLQWADLELKTAEISVTIPVTWKLEAMAVDQFMDYLLNELKEQIADSKIDGVIYGSGSDDMEGVTAKAVQKTYSGTVLTAIEANIGALTSKQKRGAKLYISTSAAENVQFSKNTDGDYIFPLNLGLPKTIAGYPLEVDPYLKDGDILFGNVTRYARLNTNEAMSLVKEVKGSKRRNEYTAYELDSSAAQPNSLLYIKKTAQSGGSQGGSENQ